MWVVCARLWSDTLVPRGMQGCEGITGHGLPRGAGVEAAGAPRRRCAPVPVRRMLLLRVETQTLAVGASAPVLVEGVKHSVWRVREGAAVACWWREVAGACRQCLQEVMGCVGVGMHSGSRHTGFVGQKLSPSCCALL